MLTPLMENTAGHVKYTKDALAKYRLLDYKNSIKGHYGDLNSTNTLRFSVQNVILDTTADRFKS